MYPKVKVKEQIEEAGQYAYERSSLLSLKAFEWLSAHHFSPSDESPHLVVRIPGSFVPKSPPPTFHTPKEETSKNDNMGVEENRKNARANSAPRPRAVLSSPDNDGIFGGKRQTRKELISGLTNNTSGQNKQPQSKVFPKSAVSVSLSPAQSHKKEATENPNNVRAKARTAIADSSVRTRHSKRVAPAPIQS
ncbi:uncharacterized protein [Primulina huaijiensis]|uniref:uncharacterized protein n=1 Tax=Primulina huaijiensis TaxID=1492673 RepID=UPI003CC6E7EE